MQWMRWASAWPLAAALLATGAPALANPFEKTLDNGMKVIVKEDRRAPTAVHMVWYRAGSVDEVDGTSGVAHVLEHLMFKGTPAVGPGEFNKRVAAAGGRDNAFTTRDYTAYFQQIPKEKLEDMIKLEADRMHHLTLDPKEFAKEIQVVMEERRMRTEDNPGARLNEQLHAVALTAHPYRRPVIGWMADLEAMSNDDAKDWYNTWYVPNNATLIVVGDVDHRQVFKLAEKHYGQLPPGSLPKRKPQEEPPQQGVRRLTLKAPADLPQVMLAFRVPALKDIAKDDDVFALEVLAAVLDGHDAARLPVRLVKTDRVAVSVGAGGDSIGRGPAMFYLSGSPAPGKTVAELEKALRDEIRRVAEAGVQEDELQRARAQLIASQVFKRDSMMAQAMEIGGLEMAGFSWRDDERLQARLKAVTAAQVKAVAGKYFGDDALTVGVLEPQAAPVNPSADQRFRAAAAAALRH